MKKLIIAILILMSVNAVFAVDFKSGDELIAAMHKKYEGKWYKTLTFKQITTTYKPDGTSSDETWYEATASSLRMARSISSRTVNWLENALSSIRCSSSASTSICSPSRRPSLRSKG